MYNENNLIIVDVLSSWICCYNYLCLPVAFPLPLWKVLPSKPGRAFVFPLDDEDFRRSFRIAMLSERFFCLAAMEAVT